VTDRLTVAAFIPYQYARYQFDAWLVPSPPRNGVQLQPAHWSVKDPKALTCPGGNFQLNNPSDLVKILDEQNSNYNFNVGDLRKAFISDCLNYNDPVDTVQLESDGFIHGTSDRTLAGFRDLVVGAKYQFYHGRHLELSSLIYVTAPTGQMEQPNDLFHLKLGDGTWNLAGLLGMTLPLGRLRIFGSAGYEYVFSNTMKLRLPNLSFSDELEQKLASGQITEKDLIKQHLDEATLIPIVTKYDTATVNRKLGDNIYVYAGASFDILEWLNVGIRFDNWFHFRDAIQSIDSRFENGSPYLTDAQIRANVDQLITSGQICTDKTVPLDTCRTNELSAELKNSAGRRMAAYAWHTIRGQIIGGVSIGFNFLPAWLRGDFPIPLIGAIYASRFLAGENIDITDMVGISLVVPIPFGDIKDPAEYGFDDDDEPDHGLPWP
jgi:hypothetical protein